MATFYHVDRLARLSAGQYLKLQVHNDIQPAELQAHVDGLFPTGVSAHGEQFLLRSSSLASVASPALELQWEYVRRARFPEKLSRFTSFFGTETLEGARAFRASFCNFEAPIWEVEADNSHVGDMGLLHIGHTVLMLSYFAELYWQGATLPNKNFMFREVLMPFPVAVLRLVEGGPPLASPVLDPTLA